MEFLSPQFFSALAAIVVIDLVLAGDNAIVIALAARNVPAHLQKKAIAWGTVGAIVVRSLMTVVVVWLLQIPGLLFAGGLILVWIAYKLLLPDADEGDGHGKIQSASTFWGAMRTIVIADAVMGMDNVLAVAGAAHGSYLLVILGLLISIPIVVWGSSILLKWIERYPIIVYVGAGVLAATSVKMMLSEPVVKEYFAGKPFLVILAYLVIVLGVLFAGFLRNHRRLESRIHARIAQLSAQQAAELESEPQKQGSYAMKNVLVPVGDARNAAFAVKRVINEYINNPDLRIHILNVQPPLSRHISQFVLQKTRDEFHAERAEIALQPARALFAQRNIPFEAHMRLGDRAHVIADEAKRLRCDRIVMATARKNSLTRMLETSTTNRVLELTTVPVELVAGDEVSKLEKFGVPAGIGAAIALVVAAALD